MSTQPGALSQHRVADLVVLLVLAGLVVLYCLDAVQASRHIYNLILVLPLTVVVLLLCLAQFMASALVPAEAEQEREAVAPVLPVVGLFAAYVLSLPWVGFDVGTFLFIAASLRVHGERRWPWLLGYSISFASLVSLFFSAMLPYPMPMLILGTAY